MLNPRRKRQLRPALWLAVEGETEENHVRGMMSHERIRTPAHCIKSGKNCLGLLEKAIDNMDSRDYRCELDETWIVFDRDKTNSDATTKENFTKTLSWAEGADIKVAYANDRFEVCPLLLSTICRLTFAVELSPRSHKRD